MCTKLIVIWSICPSGMSTCVCVSLCLRQRMSLTPEVLTVSFLILLPSLTWPYTFFFGQNSLLITYNLKAFSKSVCKVTQSDTSVHHYIDHLTVHHPLIQPLFLILLSICTHLCAFKSKNSSLHLLFAPLITAPTLISPSISPSISDLFANQTPSVLPSPTCQEQLPAALLTTLLTTLPHLPRPAACAGRTSPIRATASFTGAGRHRQTRRCMLAVHKVFMVREGRRPGEDRVIKKKDNLREKDRRRSKVVKVEVELLLASCWTCYEPRANKIKILQRKRNNGLAEGINAEIKQRRDGAR